MVPPKSKAQIGQGCYRGKSSGERQSGFRCRDEAIKNGTLRKQACRF
jgi:hypothetical protein